MPNRKSVTGVAWRAVRHSELFIVNNSDENRKVPRWLHHGCQISKKMDIYTGYLDISTTLSSRTAGTSWGKSVSLRGRLGKWTPITQSFPPGPPDG